MTIIQNIDGDTGVAGRFAQGLIDPVITGLHYPDRFRFEVGQGCGKLSGEGGVAALLDGGVKDLCPAFDPAVAEMAHGSKEKDNPLPMTPDMG